MEGGDIVKMTNAVVYALSFAFAFSFSFGFQETMLAGDNPGIFHPSPCTDQTDVNKCCFVDFEMTQRGICVSVGPDIMDVVCECTCLHVQYPTCDGPYGCQYDVCPVGGGS